LSGGHRIWQSVFLGEKEKMNQSHAAYYYKLSADQDFAEAQYDYGSLPFHGEGISMNKSLAAHYF
jgi:TPR repeat protein